MHSSRNTNKLRTNDRLTTFQESTMKGIRILNNNKMSINSRTITDE